MAHTHRHLHILTSWFLVFCYHAPTCLSMILIMNLESVKMSWDGMRGLTYVAHVQVIWNGFEPWRHS
ncbi:hypothetical protein AALP_AA8G165700 [Arabis alpina]|uniref:Uncharacterized protein n=1 Tax=Arabis alpina TaxID=50452 RepID=A0A087G7G9_ARAAL|nr:hypothetical protein AALP_AA8G165700 [Arabis alpina]